MRIGILESGKLDPVARGKYGGYPAMFQRLLLSVDDQLQFNVYDITE
jgi:hypothetical protein